MVHEGLPRAAIRPFPGRALPTTLIDTQQLRWHRPQVLSRDVRSVTQRIKVPLKAKHGQVALTLQGGVEHSHPGLVPQLGSTGNSSSGGSKGSSSSACKCVGDEEEHSGSPRAAAVEGTWHVVLAGVDISYDVHDEESGRISVILRTASALC